MAATDSSTPNGLTLDEAPTPDALDPGMNGGAGPEDDGDLFGSDEDEDEDNNDGNRKLDDSELDSGDDQGRTDRLADTVEDEYPTELVSVSEANTDLVPIRAPEGDEMYLLPLPSFLGLAHHNYNPTTYEAPTKAHDKEAPPEDPSKFSAFDTATTTMFWRHDPKNPELLQSNARIVRWDDGSLTLQLATKPLDHYRISTSAFRQNYSSKTNKLYPLTSEYDPNKDTNNFIAAYHASQGVDLQLIRPLDASIRIQPTGDIPDDSMLRLQAGLAASIKTHDPLSHLKRARIDPEIARKQAEKADKEAQARARKAKNAEEALEFKRDSTLRRGGVGGRGAGLSVAGLEDDDGMPTARGRKAQAKKRKMNRRGEIYSDDEDDTEPRRRTREDEYDHEDNFLADSDEEVETYEEDEEDEDAEGEEDDAPPDAVSQRSDRPNRPRDRRSATPKRPADDDDAGPGVTGSPQARKKRRVIDDDDDE